MQTKTSPKAVDRLLKLGFTTAAKQTLDILTKKRQLALAYEHYRFVKQEAIDAFNKKLKADTITGKEPYNAHWKTLSFTPIENYAGTPPDAVLDALELAQDRECFDVYEVAFISDVRDPLLFGRVNGCPDRFFIEQWDDDISIDDLLKRNEG